MERYRPNVYCDLDFLKSTLSMLDAENTSIDNSYFNNRVLTANIRKLILSPDIKLFLNITSDEYVKVLSDIEKKRIKDPKTGKGQELTPFDRLFLDMEQKQQNNMCHLHFNAKKVLFDDTLLQGNYLNATFFSSETKETCQQAMKEYGIIVICKETIKDFDYLFFDHGSALRRYEESDWEKCLSNENETNPCNSLIVVDNYVLNDGIEMDENLTSLFSAIIPKSLKPSVTFDLTIFATLKNDRNTEYDIKGRFDKVMEILQKVRPKMNFSLSILKCKKDNFHDRNILSGNLFVGCGFGFNLFKNGKSQKTTTICAFHPFFYMNSIWPRKAYSDMLNEASSCFKKASVLEKLDLQYRCTNFVYGTKQNRLLDQIH